MDSSPLEDVDPLAISGYETKCETETGCRDDYIKSELVDNLERDFPEEDDVKPILHIELHEYDINIGVCESYQQDQQDPLALAPEFSVEHDELRNMNLSESESTWEKSQLRIKQEITENLSQSSITSHVGKMEKYYANSSAFGLNNDQNKPYFVNDKHSQAVQNNRSCKKDIAMHMTEIEEEQCQNLTSSIIYSINNGSHQQQWENTLSNKLCGPQSSTEMPSRTRIKEKRMECNKFKLLSNSIAPKTQSDVCTNSLNIVCNQSPTLTMERPYCDLCKKLFSTSYYLRLHKLSHTGVKPYQCEICEKSFTRKSSLQLHSRIHTGEKPYQCNFCTKTFIDRSNLVRHVRKHNGERPFKCNVCGQSFYQKCSLLGHLRNHSGERPYQCDVCKQTFHWKCSMRRHFRGHTSERPYRCEICKKSFRLKSYLAIHNATHTGQRRHKCDVCKDTFTRISSLIKHKEKHITEGHIRVMYSVIQPGQP